MWYSATSTFTRAGRLAGPVQTSFKAETRAILHVLRTAGVPTCIMCDCLTVVRQFNAILQDPLACTEDHADGELWEKMRELVASAPNSFFQCQWIPSHLDDADHPNHKKRDKYLRDGTTTLQHIHGNAQADKVADEGTALHTTDADALYDAKIRTKITRIVQNMMVTIWREHRDKEDVTTDTDIADIMAIEAARVPGHCTYDDYDYNPFDNDNNHTNTNHVDTSPITTHNQACSDAGATEMTSESEVEQLKRRFPTYPWTNGGNLMDGSLAIAYTNADNPRTFKGAKFSSITSSKNKLITVKQEVSYCMWHPLTEWLSTLFWTYMQPTGGKKQRDHGGNVTLAELTIAFQNDTGYNICSKNTYFDTQVSCFTAACTKVMCKAEYATNGRIQKYRNTMRPRNTILTTESITGCPAPGLQRRPLWSTETTDLIARTIYDHHARACALAASATEAYRNDYKINYPKGRQKWVPDHVADVMVIILRRNDERDNSSKRARNTSNHEISEEAEPPNVAGSARRHTTYRPLPLRAQIHLSQVPGA